MVDYQEINATRRISQIIMGANQPKFTLISYMLGIFLVALVITGIGAIFS